jgi:uncharacterized membrane protein YdbT with pleckstrin-like domain
MTDEKQIFLGSSSQFLNAPVFAGCGLAAGILIALAFVVSPLTLAGLPVALALAGWRWLKVRTRVYEVTTERIRIRDGILTRRTEELELYRVADITLVEPLPLRLFGLGDIVLSTNDVSHPRLQLPALRGVQGLREALRSAVEERRERKHVRVTEME